MTLSVSISFPWKKFANYLMHCPKSTRYINAAPITFKLLPVLSWSNSREMQKLSGRRKAPEVKKTFLSVFGVGTGIANMALFSIESAYGVTFSDLDHSHMDIKPDVHTMRALSARGRTAR